MGWDSAMRGWAAEQRAAGKAESSIRLWRHYLRRFAAEYPKPWAVTRIDVIDWMAGRAWAPATRKCARTALRSFYGWAGEAGLIDEDPTARLPKVRVPRGQPRPAPDDVIVQAMLAATARVRLMLMLAAFLGLRRAEIAQVRTGDLDGRMLFVRGKGGKERLVPVPRSLAVLIADRPPGWLFPSGSSSGHLTPWYVGKLMSRSLPGRWTAHTLRHAAATAWAHEGLDIDELAELLGHSDPATTRIYKLISSRKLAAGVEAAAERLLHLPPAGA